MKKKIIVVLGFSPDREAEISATAEENGHSIFFCNTPENTIGKTSTADLVVVNVDMFPGFVRMLVGQEDYKGEIIPLATRVKTMNTGIPLPKGEMLWPVAYRGLGQEIERVFA